jgi:hypothetical protein
MFVVIELYYRKYTYNVVQILLELENHTIELTHNYYDSNNQRYETKLTQPEQIVACLEQLLALAETVPPETNEHLQIQNEERIKDTEEALNQVRGYLNLPNVKKSDKFLKIGLRYGPDYTEYEEHEGPFYPICACGKPNNNSNIHLTTEIKAKINFTTGKEKLKITLNCHHQHKDVALHKQNTLDLTQIPAYITEIEQPEWHTITWKR